MKKVHNRGVSFVELVIAVAIFAILICPIVNALIQATKTSDKSKKAQTKYEYAENMMENVKSAGSYFYDTSKVKDDPYLAQVTDGAITVTTKETSDVGGKVYDGYVITGKAKTSKKDGDYYYAIHVSNKEYAAKESVDGIDDPNDPDYDKAYKNPNNTTIPAIADFSSSDLAIINGTIGNYDLTVTNAFMSKKLDILKVGDKARWEQYTKQQADIVAFPNDKAARAIVISVTEGKKQVDGKEKTVYTVTCNLKYMEKSTYLLKDGSYAGKTLSDYLSPIEYTPYKQKFVDTLPAIYLMYNPCLYNSNYMDYDYILLDTDGLNSDVSVDLFVVETAEKYSDSALDGMLEVYKEQYKKEHGTQPSKSQLEQVKESYEKAYLINNDAIRERSNVNVDVMSNSGDLSNIKVYHNFDVNEKNKTPIASVNKALNSADSALYSGYTLIDKSLILPMSQSSTKANALYKIDVYISDSPFTATSVSDFESSVAGQTPIISGSKGGN